MGEANSKARTFTIKQQSVRYTDRVGLCGLKVLH